MLDEITGKTALLLMLADPVTHIRGTILINNSLAELGLDARIVPLKVAPADLAATVENVRRLGNVAGLGITIPHKIAILPLLNDLTPEARKVGAVNFVRRDPDGRLTGTNIDGSGFVAGLRANGVRISGRRALMVGAGGVARAISFALADAGVNRLVILNRDLAKAEVLARDVALAAPQCEVLQALPEDAPQGNDLVVNATSLGMTAGDPLPLPVRLLPQGGVVAEVVVNPAMTPLLAAAAERGCQIVPGAEMLKPQPALFARFMGLLPDADA